MAIKLLVVSNYAVTRHNVRPEAEMVIGLQQRGIAVEVMTPANCYYAGRMADAGITIHDYLPPGKFSREASQRIRQVLQTGGHQVQYLFNNPAIATGLRASRGLPVATVTYRGQVGNISRYNPLSYLTHLHPRVDRIVCVANAVRDGLRRELRDPAKAVTIYKGHDIRWYETVRPANLADLGIPAGAFVVICVATNRPRKGVPVLLDAVSRLPDESPIHLLLVGGGMDSAQIGTLLKANPRRNRVHRLGHRDDVLELVAGAQAAILPSLRREGLPKTVIEAMALGLPAVVTRTGGSPELVEPGESGLVVPPGDPDALAGAMLQLSNNPSSALQMGQAARQRLIRDFNLPSSIDQHVALFGEIVGGRQALPADAA